MSKLVTLTYTITISASQEQVFAYLTDWEKQSEWILFTQVRKTSSGDNGVGTTLSARTGLGPVGFIDTMLVEEWKPPIGCTVVHTGKVVRGKGVFTITKLSETSTEFAWDEITPVPLGAFGRFGLIFMKPVLGYMFNRSLRMLKRSVELTSAAQ